MQTAVVTDMTQIWKNSRIKNRLVFLQIIFWCGLSW